ncbi:multidrug transporter MATE [Mycoplasmopsis anatis]|uniref:MATE family efflux transporter n=1 Tax=Mycoplasmopsis anatis TaxID=171279 RepID=UPI001C4DEB17|nr:MATE family efflux transporter [Mycoplasmopsis anatis]MBW0594693.1 multidrug transporter MATE [Mycoplasmopsis anatis]MBW0595510.1 multidrug transporter MATE [Mycoplasmopsis anatis]MBW0598272.1 multidrug transporter MATE [Mycoplasmopsis anatis]MBW0599123.1 multidrug transporter MATE [Mycoplasmopsis anatis]MBW0601130.1 multidrug transporter MATE [Mycoplasmopsis anatis]
MNFFWLKKEQKNSDVTDKQARAKLLFENTPVKKAIFIVAIPGLATSLMLGLAAFLNQIFILNFVPDTIFLLNTTTNGASQSGILYDYLPSGYVHLNREQFDLIYNAYNIITPISDRINELNTNQVSSIAVNANVPFTIFSNSIVFLIPVGTSVYYTKCVSKGLERTGKDLWSTAFYATIICSILATLIMYITLWSGLVEQIASKTKFESSSLYMIDRNTELLSKFNEWGISNYKPSQIIQQYYNSARDISISWAKLYIYIYCGGTLIQGMYLLLSYLIRAEGKNVYVMFWAIVANIFDVILNVLLIRVAKMGILGAAISTILAWSVNLIAYVIYVYKNNKSQTTWLSIHHLINFKFRYKFLGPVGLLGFSGFIRSVGVAVGSLVITLLLTKLPYSNGASNVYLWAKASPIITLFFLALFGIADGARSLLSYAYTKRDVNRVKQVYWYALMISFGYALIVYSIVAILAPHFLYLLRVEPEVMDKACIYLRINMLRLAFYSFATGAMLLFQGTNNIKNSIIATSMEGFLTFFIVMGISVGFGFLLSNYGVDDFNSALVISIGYASNSLIAGLINFTISTIYLKKKIPNIDNIKLSWSRKIEHKFFAEAELYEKQYLQSTQH